MNISDQFDYLETNRLKQTAIRLNQEPFKDIVYVYGNVSFDEPKIEGEDLKVEFSYTFLKNPYHDDEIDWTKLKKLMGDILIYTIMTQIETGKLDLNDRINESPKHNPKPIAQ